MNNWAYIYISVKNANTRIYICWKKIGHFGHTPLINPVLVWVHRRVRRCVRAFIENEVRTIEKDIERWLGNQLKKLGCIYMKFVSPGNDGVPDRIVVLPGGSVIFIELKATTGKLMANQRVQISRLRKQGAIVFVLTGKLDAKLFLDDIERVIHGLSSTRVPRDCYSADN